MRKINSMLPFSIHSIFIEIERDVYYTFKHDDDEATRVYNRNVKQFLSVSAC